MKNVILLLVLTAGLAAGCGKEPAPPKVQAVPETKAETLHRKARAAQLGNLVGYDGKQIQKNLDKIIDANEQHAKDVEDAGKVLQGH